MATFALEFGTRPMDTAPVIATAPERRDAVSIVLSLVLAVSVALIAIASTPVLVHWFLLPLTVCGFLIGVDLMDWLRGRVDLFDARGTLGVLGFHFFLVAPLLMVASNYRMKYLPEQPDDYRDWLGYMGLLNAAGLLLYRLVLRRPARPASVAVRAHTVHRWLIQPRRFWITWTLLVLASVGAEVLMLVQYGGISGYLAIYSQYLAGGGDGFEGAALLFAVAESLPILLILGFAYWAHRRGAKLWLMCSAFAVFLVLNFVIGGLRGSRSNVIWATFWAAGILHLYVRRIPRTAAFAAILALYGFVSFYAAYKQHGVRLLDDYTTSGGDSSSLNQGVEDLPTVLVGDFSRTDVQANLLWRLHDQATLPLAWGRSYLGALTMVVPRNVWPERPPTLVRWSTDAEYGSGAFASGMMRSTRVYGIVGEAMMNLGLAGIPLAFLVLALAVRALGRFGRGLDRSDVRLLLLPFLVNTLFLVLLDDSDNVVFYLFKCGLIPLLLLFFSSSRVTRRFLPCKLSPSTPQPLPLQHLTHSSKATLIARPVSTSITRSRAIAALLNSGSNC